jgi:large subunit ribosomal protein L22
MEVKAVAKNIRLSPRRVRPLLRELSGKRVDEALAMLRYAPTSHARMVAKVVRSAAANAENNYQMDPRDLKITQIYAGDSVKLKRYQAKARGRAGMMQHRFCNLTVVVDEGAR